MRIAIAGWLFSDLSFSTVHSKALFTMFRACCHLVEQLSDVIQVSVSISFISLQIHNQYHQKKADILILVSVSVHHY